MLVLACVLALALARSEAVAAEEAGMSELVLELFVNHQDDGVMVIVLRDANHDLWLERVDFQRLHLKLPTGSARMFHSRQYYPLSAIPGLVMTLNGAAQTADLSAPASAFLPTTFSATTRAAPVWTSTANGAFLNYQLSVMRVEGQNSTAGQGELGWFSAAGVLTNSAVYRGIGGSKTLVRLDSTFTHDLPQRLERLVVGDTISNPGDWGNAVRYAGVHWGTAFDLRPDLLTTPLLTATGTAVVPSVADVFVNNQQVTSEKLPPGPFVINNLPAVTGSGAVSIVVHDALGREQVITQPFYSSPSLLAPGLAQYSVDLGRIRNGYTLTSANYGSWMGAANYRRGLSDALTLAFHGEYLEHDAYAAGVNAAYAVGTLGVVDATAAVGGAVGGTGIRGGIGFEHHGDRLSFVASSSFTSRAFHQIGDSPTVTTAITGLPAGIAGSSALVLDLTFRERDLAQAGLQLTRGNSLALAFVHESYYSEPAQQTASLSYNLSLRERGAIALTISRTVAQQEQTSFYLGYTLALSGRRAASLAAVGGTGTGAQHHALYATLMQSPPVGNGAGYRLGAATSGDYDANWRQQTSIGDGEAEVARRSGITGQSIYWNGGATWLDGQVRATRPVTDSFAVVDVAGLARVPVYIDNQLVTHTDAHGHALLHDLLPYQANRISIDPLQLPLDTSIGERVITVTPAYRSGVVIEFPVQRLHGGTFHLVDEQGRPLPPGTQVRFLGQSFPVAFEGMTYVTDFDRAAAGQARGSAGRCNFRLPAPPPGNPLPDVGTIICHAIHE